MATGRSEDQQSSKPESYGGEVVQRLSEEHDFPLECRPDDASPSDDYYERVKKRFAEERDLRLKYRPEGTDQYVTDLDGPLAKYESDPYLDSPIERDPIVDNVEVLVIGGGFSGLLTCARLREHGVTSIRIVERAADVGGTWYWNRYPGVACDVVSYDYLPLLDEMDYVPSRRYAQGPEIFEHCRAIARRYDLYQHALFQTTVTSTVWSSEERRWTVTTDRGDRIQAQFVVCANGTLSKPKLAKIEGMETFRGQSFHTSRWDYSYTGNDLENLADKAVGIIGTGATAVQAIPNLGAAAKELYVFQRTPSSIDIREDWETDPEWATSLRPGWQAKRRERALKRRPITEDLLSVNLEPGISQEEKLRRQEQANIDYMMRIHRRIDEVVEDKETADALKPWYMFMCKRPCFHNDYLATFNRPNVHLVDTHGRGINEIRERGPVFDGQIYDVDLLIYATGFEVQKTGIYNRIVGVDGVELTEKYVDGIRTLVGVHTRGFPNLFIMGGYQSSFQFNLTDVLHAQGVHIAECVHYLRSKGYHAMDAKESAEEWWVQEVIAHRGKTSRNEECTPGYYNFEGESNRRQDGNYNGGFEAYVDHMAAVRSQIEENFSLES